MSPTPLARSGGGDAHGQGLEPPDKGAGGAKGLARQLNSFDAVEQRARVLARDKAVFQAVFEAGRTYHVTTQLKAGGGVEIVMETSDTATSDAADFGTAR